MKQHGKQARLRNVMEKKLNYVIKKLKGVLKSQNPHKSQQNRLIKDNYSVRYNDKVVSMKLMKGGMPWLSWTGQPNL